MNEGAGRADPAVHRRPIRAPQSWDADAKAKFEALPRDLQEVVLARESDRDKAVQRSAREAADARKLAQALVRARVPADGPLAAA